MDFLVFNLDVYFDLLIFYFVEFVWVKDWYEFKLCRSEVWIFIVGFVIFGSRDFGYKVFFGKIWLGLVDSVGVCDSIEKWKVFLCNIFFCCSILLVRGWFEVIFESSWKGFWM